MRAFQNFGYITFPLTQESESYQIIIAHRTGTARRPRRRELSAGKNRELGAPKCHSSGKTRCLCWPDINDQFLYRDLF